MSKRYVVYVTEQDGEFFVTSISQRDYTGINAVILPEDEQRGLVRRMKLKSAFSERRTIVKAVRKSRKKF